MYDPLRSPHSPHSANPTKSSDPVHSTVRPNISDSQQQQQQQREEWEKPAGRPRPRTRNLLGDVQHNVYRLDLLIKRWPPA